MGLLAKVDPKEQVAEKLSVAGEAHRRRYQMLMGGSCAAKVAEAMADEKPEAVVLAAKAHQRALLAKDRKSKLRGVIMGVI